MSYVRVINSKIDKKEEYIAQQNAEHITHVKDFLGKKVKLLGISQKGVTIEGEDKILTFIHTDNGTVYTSAYSFANTANDLANIFGDDIEDKGLDVVIEQVKARGDKTIYKVVPV